MTRAPNSTSRPAQSSSSGSRLRLRLPLQSQLLPILHDPARIKLITAGRGWGKTVGIRTILIGLGAEARRILYYVAPTYSLCREQYDAICDLELLHPVIARNREQPFPRIVLTNGSFLGFRSADRPNNLRGPHPDGYLCDEAAYLSPGLVEQILLPALTARRGTLWLWSTFAGEGWYYELHKRGQQPGTGVRSWLFPTHTGIAFQGADGALELERLRATIPLAIWERECMCLVRPGANSAFRFVDQIIGGAAPRERRPGARYILGWDTGKSANPSGIVIEDDAGLVVHAEARPLGEDYPIQIRRVVELARLWNALVVVDVTGTGTRDAILDFLQREWPAARGMNFKGRNQEAMVSRLDLDMQHRRVQVPARFTELVAELKLYECRYTQSRAYYAAPQGRFDDLVSAFVMANFARALGWAPASSGLPLTAAL